MNDVQLYGGRVPDEEGPSISAVECNLCGWKSPAFEAKSGRHTNELIELVISGHLAKAHGYTVTITGEAEPPGGFSG